MHSFAVFRVTCSTQQRETSTLLITYHCVMNADCETDTHNDPSPDESSQFPSHKGKRATASSSGPFLYYLILLFASFFATTLARQSLFYPLLLTRFQVVGVTLHFLDDVFLLNLPLETAEGILQRLAFLQSDFSQLLHPPTGPYWTLLDYQSQAILSGHFFMSLVVNRKSVLLVFFGSIAIQLSSVEVPEGSITRYS